MRLPWLDTIRFWAAVVAFALFLTAVALPSEAEYLVSPGDQFFDDGGANESGRAGNKDAHSKTPRLR
jgi:hypothetical protein